MTTEAPGTGQALYTRAKEIIPGGAQLLGKRAEMYLPEQWPAYYAKAKGCEVWDLDGNKYFDCTMVGIGTSVLGYADEDVERAVVDAVRAAPMCTLNAPEEVHLAELLLELHPWAERVTYARTGGEMMSKVARIVRAATGRSKVAICGYHGWHDWYLAVNLKGDDALKNHLLAGLEPRGVPPGLRDSVLTFRYNDLEELEAVVRDHGDELAAIVMEPVRSEEPAPGFLEGVRSLADKCGAALVFDEITSGFRAHTGGVHLGYGISPDVAVYAKTMSNGFAMAAAVGRSRIMDALQKTFISSAYWTERVGPSAALATINKHRTNNVGARLETVGKRVQAGWRKAADATGVQIRIHGTPALSAFNFQGDDAAALTTLFIQDLLDAGYLASDRFYPVAAHTDEIVDAYLASVEASFAHIADSQRHSRVKAELRGPVKHTGFQRLT